ncbi:hypothetical protein N7507_003749 [Penicillium longicatenatum]|nr:hypothetical protein N7507_003749 [Penicillium longicatenatum]
MCTQFHHHNAGTFTAPCSLPKNRSAMRSIISLALCLGAAAASEFKTRTVYQLASNDTWLENPKSQLYLALYRM